MVGVSYYLRDVPLYSSCHFQQSNYGLRTIQSILPTSAQSNHISTFSPAGCYEIRWQYRWQHLSVHDDDVDDDVSPLLR